MNDNDNLFLVKSDEIDKEDHVIVRYRLQTGGDFLAAAIALSKEQSFSSIEDKTKEEILIGKFAAKVLTDSIKEIEVTTIPALPIYDEKTKLASSFSTFEVDLAFPVSLFGTSLVALINMAIGEVHNIAQFSGIKVTDIEFPVSWLKKYGGPEFGIEGIREYLGKTKGPILISPVKPCVGLSPDEFAARVFECLMGGFDGVKDDELLLDPPYCSFKDRVKKTMEAVRKVEELTGKKKIYFANVGGDESTLDEMVEFALAEGVGGIMFSPLVNGFDIILKYKGRVPIIAHNNLSYGMARHPLLGVSFALYAKIQRMCGADVIICPAPDRSFYVMDKEEHSNNVAVCIEENGLKKTLAGLSGSQTPETLYSHAVFLGHHDFAICPGGAVYEHPLGIQKGAASFVASVEALCSNVSLADCALTNEALDASINFFGNKNPKFDR